MSFPSTSRSPAAPRIRQRSYAPSGDWPGRDRGTARRHCSDRPGRVTVGAAAPVRFRIGVSTALTIAACFLGLVVGADILHSGHPAVVHTTALMPLSGFALGLDRFGALFVVITAVVGICAMVFRFGYEGHGPPAGRHRASSRCS